MTRILPNGCGPWWVPSKWKDGYFIDACTIHDINYVEGYDRNKADLEFYDRMKVIIRNDKSLSYFQRKARFAQAWAFYNIVRNLGWLSHKDGLDL